MSTTDLQKNINDVNGYMKKLLNKSTLSNIFDLNTINQLLKK